MAGSTISTSVYAPVEIGAGAYKSPLTVTSTGLIDPTDAGYGDTGIYLPNSATLATIINHGRVNGAIGGYDNDLGTDGGVAIFLHSAAFLNNTAVIAGGYGDSGSDAENGGFGGSGGSGVDVLAFSTISNSSTGHIYGGAGGYADNKANNGGSFYGHAGSGGAGVYLQTGSTFTNAGLVSGGAGGDAAQYIRYFSDGGNAVTDLTEANISNSGTLIGGAGGVEAEATTPRGLEGGQGLSMDDLGHLSNSGAIIGGAGGGGGNVQFGGYGNEGVFLNEATASNTGRITGGAGAYGTEYGGGGGLGVAVYSLGSLSNSKGTITGGAGGEGASIAGGRGGAGVIVSSYGTVNNTGQIIGGAGGSAANALNTRGGGAGGQGVYLDSGSGKVTNSGTIIGGAGGAESSGSTYTSQFAGAGGVGVGAGPGTSYIRGGASIINYGVIRGGNGGNINGDGGTAGVGGAGISISDVSFSNHGTIIGGTGGAAGQAAFNYGYGGDGGAGVVIGASGTVNNVGTIIGGTGGSNIYAGTAGGAGVYIDGGIFIDTGKVTGGAGGFTQGPGASGVAVQFGGLGGTLVAGPGATFTGDIVGAYGVANFIELTGSTTTRFSGVGVSVTGIGEFSFASGAERTLEGTNYGLSGPLINGFTVNDTIVVDSFTANLTATNADPGPYIELFGTASDAVIDINRATAKELLVTDANGKTTITAVAPGTARALLSGMGEFVGAGANATGTTIKAGGFEEIYNGATATSTTIAGGELLLKIGAVAKTGIAFSTVTGGTLVINSATLPTDTISGFIAGDTIDLAGIAYNPNDKVTVGTAGTVTISTPGIAYKLDIAGATVGETDFKFSTGSVLTKTTAKQALTFISAPELSTSGTSLAPHLAGAEIFVAYAQHHITMESPFLGSSRPEPTPAATGILAFHTEAHTSLFLHLG